MRRISLATMVVMLCAFAPSALALRQVPGSPFPTGANGVGGSIAFSKGGLLAVANTRDNSVSVFFVSRRSGVLTPAPGSPFSSGVGLQPGSVAFSPNGRLLAVANFAGNTISMLSVSPTTGALTPVAGSPFAAGGAPVSLAFSATGTLLAVGDVPAAGPGSDLFMFSVNRRTGELSLVPGSPYPGGGFASVAFSRTGLVASTSTDISVSSANPRTGVLTPVPGSPFPPAPFVQGNEPDAGVFSPGGGLFADVGISGPGCGTLATYSVDRSTGGLTLDTPSAIAVPEAAESVAFSHTGHLLATVGPDFGFCSGGVGSGELSMFSVSEATGTPTELSGSPFIFGTPAGGPQPIDVAFSPTANLVAVLAASGTADVVFVFWAS